MIVLWDMGGDCLKSIILKQGINESVRNWVVVFLFFYFSFFLSLLKLVANYSFDVSRGYMTNSDLEKAVKEFGRRCRNISRIYR